MLVRIEDIDTARSREVFVEAILEDLAWLGLDWPAPVRRQSDHFDFYRAGAKRLVDAGLVYPCFCTRAEIRAAGTGETDPDGAPLYHGGCRAIGAPERAARIAAGAPHALRLDMREAIRRAGALEIAETMPTPRDAVKRRAADPGRWGDVIVVRKDTPTSYHLSVVLDDAHQGITHVTRGMDLHAATDIHVLLQALLGLAAPLYCHHALVRDAEQAKLAKSRGSQSLADLRAAGWSAADLRAHLGI